MTRRTRLRSSDARREADALGRLLTVADLAQLLSVSEWTIYYWRRRGHGPREVRLGPASQRRPRKIRFRHEDVARYLEEQAVAPVAARRRQRR